MRPDQKQEQLREWARSIAEQAEMQFLVGMIREVVAERNGLNVSRGMDFEQKEADGLWTPKMKTPRARRTTPASHL